MVNLSILKLSLPIPVPKAVINVLISEDSNILLKDARSTFKILPRNGKIACVLRSLPCFAEPPAESPSTIKSSDWAGSEIWQSANFPGRIDIPNRSLRLIDSLAFFAASRAVAASIALDTILWVSPGSQIPKG